MTYTWSNGEFISRTIVHDAIQTGVITEKIVTIKEVVPWHIIHWQKEGKTRWWPLVMQKTICTYPWNILEIFTDKFLNPPSWMALILPVWILKCSYNLQPKTFFLWTGGISTHSSLCRNTATSCQTLQIFTSIFLLKLTSITSGLAHPQGWTSSHVPKVFDIEKKIEKLHKRHSCEVPDLVQQVSHKMQCDDQYYGWIPLSARSKTGDWFLLGQHPATKGGKIASLGNEKWKFAIITPQSTSVLKKLFCSNYKDTQEKEREKWAKTMSHTRRELQVQNLSQYGRWSEESILLLQFHRAVLRDTDGVKVHWQLQWIYCFWSLFWGREIKPSRVLMNV